MCFTGGFGLAMLLDDTVVAPVLSQPSLPFGLGGAGRHRPAQRRRTRNRCRQRLPRARASFTGDALVPGERFATLKHALGDNFVHEEIPSPAAHPGRDRKQDHSVLTEHLAPDDQPDHPSQVALARTLDFLAERLAPA